MNFRKAVLLFWVFMTLPLMAAEGFRILSMQKSHVDQQRASKKVDLALQSKAKPQDAQNDNK